jgi:hypothetical protein
MLGDGCLGVAAHPVHADDAGLALQHAGFANRGDEEEVVRGGGDAEVEVVVALVELGVVAADVTVAAGLDRGLDHAQLRRAGAVDGQPAGVHLLDAPELEEHEYMVEVGGHEESAPPAGPEHAFAVRHLQAAALLGADAAGRRENLHRVADHRAAGAQA